MTGSYNALLVCLSILIAVTASFTALDLAGRIRASKGWVSYGWLTAAALAMGGGIWAMHFVGMLAFAVPGMPVQYDLRLTLLSLLVPVVVTGVGFLAISRRGSPATTLVPGGLFMGLGIGAMHYVGMAAMKMHADLSFEAPWVVASFVIAILAATVSLWCAAQTPRLGPRALAALAMGLAVAGMHYAAMEGAVFHVSAGAGMPGDGGMDAMALALAVTALTFIILFLALVAATYDRRVTTLSDREAAAMRHSEERYRALYSRTPLPLHSLDREGRVEYVSDSWLELLGYGREEVIGRRVAEFMTADSARKARNVDFPALIEMGQMRDAEYCFVTKAGALRDVLASARTECDVEGRLMHVLCGLTDVTARRQVEAALRQSQKMEAIGKLTGGVAHDFNNLLAVIVGNLELLAKRVPQDAKAARHIANALEGAHRGASLTQRMLAFARKQDLKPGLVDLPDLVRSMSQLLQRSVGPTIQLETHFPLSLPKAYVDANQLELVLLNLAVNARDAMPDGGRIIFEATTRLPDGASAGDPGRFVCLSVRDTGEGMDEETLSRAAEPFFTTKGVGKGTGLGLSMAQGLAEQSGGRLVLKSSRGKGTTVELWLPVAEPGRNRDRESESRPPEPAVAHLAPPALPPMTVMVVDDDPLVLTNTVAMIEDLGPAVVSACTGAQALELLRAGTAVDLLVTDQAMPGMTGTQLAAIVATEQPRLPVLLVSGFAEAPDGTPGRLRKLGKLGKPFTQEALARAMSETIEAWRTSPIP